jgi:hypothetical protein
MPSSTGAAMARFTCSLEKACFVIPSPLLPGDAAEFSGDDDNDNAEEDCCGCLLLPLWLLLLLFCESSPAGGGRLITTDSGCFISLLP